MTMATTDDDDDEATNKVLRRGAPLMVTGQHIPLDWTIKRSVRFIIPPRAVYSVDLDQVVGEQVTSEAVARGTSCASCASCASYPGPPPPHQQQQQQQQPHNHQQQQPHNHHQQQRSTASLFFSGSASTATATSAVSTFAGHPPATPDRGEALAAAFQAARLCYRHPADDRGTAPQPRARDIDAWRVALRSLAGMVRHGQVSHFYMACGVVEAPGAASSASSSAAAFFSSASSVTAFRPWSALFTSASTAGSAPRVLVTRTSHGFRRALTDQGIEYSMPYRPDHDPSDERFAGQVSMITVEAAPATPEARDKYLARASDDFTDDDVDIGGDGENNYINNNGDNGDNNNSDNNNNNNSAVYQTPEAAGRRGSSAPLTVPRSARGGSSALGLDDADKPRSSFGDDHDSGYASMNAARHPSPSAGMDDGGDDHDDNGNDDNININANANININTSTSTSTNSRGSVAARGHRAYSSGRGAKAARAGSETGTASSRPRHQHQQHQQARQRRHARPVEDYSAASLIVIEGVAGVHAFADVMCERRWDSTGLPLLLAEAPFINGTLASTAVRVDDARRAGTRGTEMVRMVHVDGFVLPRALARLTQALVITTSGDVEATCHIEDATKGANADAASQFHWRRRFDSDSSLGAFCFAPVGGAGAGGSSGAGHSGTGGHTGGGKSRSSLSGRQRPESAGPGIICGSSGSGSGNGSSSSSGRSSRSASIAGGASQAATAAAAAAVHATLSGGTLPNLTSPPPDVPPSLNFQSIRPRSLVVAGADVAGIARVDDPHAEIRELTSPKVPCFF
jgi:hypothetical protein